jgi:hypothetical protein
VPGIPNLNAAANIARIDLTGANFGKLTAGFTLAFDGEVNALALTGTDSNTSNPVISVGGFFQHETDSNGPVLANAFGWFDIGNGGYDTGFIQSQPVSFGGAIASVAYANGFVYVAGAVNSYDWGNLDEAVLSGIGKIDLAPVLDRAFVQAVGVTGNPGAISVVQVVGSTLFVGGNFTGSDAAYAKFVDLFSGKRVN